MINSYLRGIMTYFDTVLHPASGWSDQKSDKKRKPLKDGTGFTPSPECFNIRAAAKKQDKVRRNPAP